MLMSAYLDKSQGITFVYSSIFELYKQAKEAKLDSPYVAERPRVMKEANSQVSNYEPKELKAEHSIEMTKLDSEKSKLNQPLTNLQKNLKDLSSAHEKLRFLLQELESLTKKK
jgi:hypothetical protein